MNGVEFIQIVSLCVKEKDQLTSSYSQERTEMASNVATLGKIHDKKLQKGI